MFARLLALSLTFIVASFPAQAGRLIDMEIVNRSSGETLNAYRQGSQSWVAGNPGDRYAVRLVNRTDQRVLVVLSVDGVNAVSGETAASSQTGYVLGPWEQTEVSGWRKSLQEVAQFYFTELPDSYAARTDRPDNLGVIGAAVFREKRYPPTPVMPYLSREAPAARPEGLAADAAGRSAAPAAKAMRESERLGTGHGQREYAPIQYTEFERASRTPNEVISLRYDSRASLASRGIIPKPRPYWRKPDGRDAQPFPGEFVPDPRS